MTEKILPKFPREVIGGDDESIVFNYVEFKAWREACLRLDFEQLYREYRVEFGYPSDVMPPWHILGWFTKRLLGE